MTPSVARARLRVERVELHSWCVLCGTSYSATAAGAAEQCVVQTEYGGTAVRGNTNAVMVCIQRMRVYILHHHMYDTTWIHMYGISRLWLGGLKSWNHGRTATPNTGVLAQLQLLPVRVRS